MFCSNCGADLADTAQGCWRCNTPILREANTPSVSSTVTPVVVEPELYGLGGWLMFFWIALCLAPFINIGNAIHNMRPFAGAITIGISVLCIVAAFRVYRLDPSALDVLRTLIIVELIHALTIAVWVAYDLPHRTDVIGNAGFGQAGLKFVRMAAWWLYFRESVRVRNTFGRNI